MEYEPEHHRKKVLDTMINELLVRDFESEELREEKMYVDEMLMELSRDIETEYPLRVFWASIAGESWFVASSNSESARWVGLGCDPEDLDILSMPDVGKRFGVDLPDLYLPHDHPTGWISRDSLKRIGFRSPGESLVMYLGPVAFHPGNLVEMYAYRDGEIDEYSEGPEITDKDFEIPEGNLEEMAGIEYDKWVE